MIPVYVLTHDLSLYLLLFLIFMNSLTKLASFANGTNYSKLSREVIQSSTLPIELLINSDNFGLQQWIHLLGVTPFVLF